MPKLQVTLSGKLCPDSKLLRQPHFSIELSEPFTEVAANFYQRTPIAKKADIGTSVSKLCQLYTQSITVLHGLEHRMTGALRRIAKHAVAEQTSGSTSRSAQLAFSGSNNPASLLMAELEQFEIENWLKPIPYEQLSDADAVLHHVTTSVKQSCEALAASFAFGLQWLANHQIIGVQTQDQADSPCLLSTYDFETGRKRLSVCTLIDTTNKSARTARSQDRSGIELVSKLPSWCRNQLVRIVGTKTSEHIACGGRESYRSTHARVSAVAFGPYVLHLFQQQDDSHTAESQPSESQPSKSQPKEIPNSLPSLSTENTEDQPQHLALSDNATPESATSKTWLNLGNQYFELGKYDKARDAFTRALEMNDRSAKSWNNLAVTWEALDDPFQAQYAYQKSLEINHRSPQTWNALGVLFDRLQQLLDAEDAFRHAVEFNDSDSVTWNNLGVTLEKLGRPAEAEKAFEKSLQLNNKDANTWSNLGVSLRKSGDEQRAAESHQQALTINSKSSRSWESLGVALDQLGRWDEAIDAFEEAIELDPRRAASWNNLGVTLEKQGHRRKAERALRTSLELDGSAAAVWKNLGWTLDRENRHLEAVKAYHSALDLDDTCPITWNKLGLALDNLGQHQQAVKAYRKSIQWHDRDACVWDNLGFSLNRLARYEEAEKALRRSLRIESDRPSTWFNLANVLENQGRAGESQDAMCRSIELSGSEADSDPAVVPTF